MEAQKHAAGILTVGTLYDQTERLRFDGIVPVAAHPERNHAVQDRPADLEGLVRAGAVIQLTVASVDGRLGRASAGCSSSSLPT